MSAAGTSIVEATVASEKGLRPRAAAAFAEAVRDTGAGVRIRLGAIEVDAADPDAVAGLGAGYGDVVALTAEGDGAQAALDELATVLSFELD